jgi:hypothetical protein
MHAQELVVKHAMGLCKRRRGGKVVDENPEGLRLRDLCKTFASKVMDKKAKSRFLEFEELSIQTYNCKPIKLTTPNDTRVSGVYLMFASLLRCKSLCQVLSSNTKNGDAYKDCWIKSDDWKLMAEFESILSFSHQLAMVSQTQDPGEIAFTWYEVSMFKYSLLQKRKKIKVIDCFSSWSPNKTLEELPRATLTYEQLQPTTKDFINRLLSELDNYFPTPDSDQIIAMNLHPIMVQNGFR